MNMESAISNPPLRHSNLVIPQSPAAHDATGRFDYANPLFTVNVVGTAMRVIARRGSERTPQDLLERQDHARLKDTVGPGRDLLFGLPRTGRTNCLWFQLFNSALHENRRQNFGTTLRAARRSLEVFACG